MSRRLELLAWARENNGWIIEDDYASEFRYSGRPLSSLQGLDDSARVIYVGTLNKALFPGLRLGYAVVPPLLSGGRFADDPQPDGPSAAEPLPTGRCRIHATGPPLRPYPSHAVAVSCAARRARGRTHPSRRRLDAVEVPDQGMHLVAYLRGGLSDVAIQEAAHAGGVIVRSISQTSHVAAPAGSADARL